MLQCFPAHIARVRVSHTPFSVFFFSLSCRGFGFVTFTDAASVDKVLAQQHHELDSKTVSSCYLHLCKSLFMSCPSALLCVLTTVTFARPCPALGELLFRWTVRQSRNARRNQAFTSGWLLYFTFTSVVEWGRHAPSSVLLPHVQRAHISCGHRRACCLRTAAWRRFDPADIGLDRCRRADSASGGETCGFEPQPSPHASPASTSRLLNPEAWSVIWKKKKTTLRSNYLNGLSHCCSASSKLNSCRRSNPQISTCWNKLKNVWCGLLEVCE